MRKRQRWSAARYKWTRPHTVLALVLLLFLLFAVFIPAAIIVSDSVTVQDQRADVRLAGKPAGSFSLVYWQRMLTSTLSQVLFYTPLWNTLKIAAAVGILATVGGTLLAWLVTRTDLPGKSIITAFAVIPNIVPSWSLALAWLLAFRRAEYSGTGGLLEAMGWDVPVWLAYGPVPIIVVLTINYIAFSFLLVSIAARRVDATLEDNAIMLGASTPRVLLNISLPLIAPSIISSFVLIVAGVLGSFSVAQFLGTPVRYNVLSTVLYQNVRSGRLGEAYVQTILMIIFTGFLLWMYQRATLGGRRSFVTVSGKGLQQRTWRLGRWRTPLATILLVLLSIFAIGPISLIVVESFLETSGKYQLDNLTTHYWVGQAEPGWGPTSLPGVLTDPQIRRAMWNTFRMAFTSAALVGIASFLFGYPIVRGRGSFMTKLVDQASFAPYLIPGLVFGAIYLSTYAAGFGPIPPLYGSYILLITAAVTNLLPFAARIGTNVQTQISADLEDSALTFGSWWPAFRRILLPLSKDGFVISFILGFIGIAKELDLVALLVPARDPVLTWYTLTFYQEGYFQHWAAISLLILLLIIIIVGIAYVIGFNVLDRNEGSL